jgi:pilus assembly protein FimV
MDLDLGSPASLEGAKPPGATTIHPLHPDPHYDMTADATPAPKSPSHSIENISLDLGEPPSMPVPPSAPPASGPKDDHWYDVQTKFDLAKAYQEMGDKDGAREILQEVIKEGDAAQNAEAQQLLATLA